MILARSGVGSRSIFVTSFRINQRRLLISIDEIEFRIWYPTHRTAFPPTEPIPGTKDDVVEEVTSDEEARVDP